jgi:methylenetetrahydrofolate dehydrogenase (NADP+)/methenyltetrahydrofolate cyclohydrolase
VSQRAAIIDGKAIALVLRGKIAQDVASTNAARPSASHPFAPCLAAVLVGDDPASAVYVRNKAIAMRDCGMRSEEHHLSAASTEATLLDLVARLNADPEVHGILVQLPLPAQINPARVIEAIEPAKDVDGFHPLNVGRLAAGQAALVPCTPLGCMILLRDRLPSLDGLEAVVIGRSQIVGRPVAQLLLAANCTVTIAHSKTRDLAAVAARADILVAAAGKAEMVRGHWIKPGATVIDVGINRVAGAGGKARLVGDVCFEEAVQIAGAITPVPGGVGPMTIACLLSNTLQAARAQAGIGDKPPGN